MKIKKQILHGFLLALGVLVYVALVSFIMHSGEKAFGNDNQIFTVVAMLMLLVLSAAIVGSLIFGLPIYYIFDKQIRPALHQLLINLGWLAVLTTVVLLLMI